MTIFSCHYMTSIKHKMYSNDEKVDLLLIYDECRKNAYAVVRLFMRSHILAEEYRLILLSEVEIKIT
jgi:hypothetical protein